MAFNFLIVDDSKVVRSVIEKTLRMADIPLGKVSHAGNGREGLACLREDWVDLIFADINMPEMNGVEMIERLADDGVLQATPVVVISTEGSETRIDHLKQLGVAGYLRKPFKPEEFSNLVTSILGTRHV